MGQLVFQATAGGQVALVGPNPATNFSLNVPAVNGNLVTTGDTGTVTNTMLASSAYTAPGTIGSGTPNTGAFTSLSASTSITNSSLTAGRVVYTGTGGLESASANLTFNGTTLTVANDASINGLTVGKGGGSLSANTAVGVSALNSITSGNWNTALGYQAGYTNTTGTNNTAIGRIGLYLNSTGSNNTSVGSQALYSNTASDNTAVGTEAMYANTSGTANTAIGRYALQANTTASNNTAVGYQAGYSTTTAGSNAYFGSFAGYSSTTTTNNTAIGYASAYSNTTGSLTALGYTAGYQNTTGSNNTFLGNGAGYWVTTGNYNTFVGSRSTSTAAITGSSNSCFGDAAGYALTGVADSNTLLGQYAGGTITSGFGNVCVGSNTQISTATGSYQLVISTGGGTGKGNSTGFITAAGGSIYQGNNSTLWAITSDQRLKKNIVDNNDGLDKITQIRVRNFEYRTADEVTELPKSSAIDIQGVQLGAIAQELIEILPDCVKTESTGVMSVDASNITWHLINAVKELNAKVTALEAKLGE